MMQNLPAFMRNWQTTALGFGSILLTLGQANFSGLDIRTQWPGLIVGLIGILARDAKG